MKKLRLLSVAALLVSSSVVTANDEVMQEMMQEQGGFDIALSLIHI